MLGNGEHFFSQELMAFGGYVPDAEEDPGHSASPSACWSAGTVRRSLVRATARFAEPGSGLRWSRSQVTMPHTSSSRRSSPRSCGRS